MVRPVEYGDIVGGDVEWDIVNMAVWDGGGDPQLDAPNSVVGCRPVHDVRPGRALVTGGRSALLDPDEEVFPGSEDVGQQFRASW